MEEEGEELLLLRVVGRVGVSPCSSSTLGHWLGHFLPSHEEADMETGEGPMNKVFGGVLDVLWVF